MRKGTSSYSLTKDQLKERERVAAENRERFNKRQAAYDEAVAAMLAMPGMELKYIEEHFNRHTAFMFMASNGVKVDVKVEF